jgi:HK97 family phage prohead protease
MKTANLGITIKSVDERSRIVRGIASTGSLDRQGDIVEPLGARWRGADLPFLVSHNHSMVVGRVKFSPPTAKGIEFEAHLPEIREPGPLRDRVETAYQELKYGLIKSVSIGFKPVAGKVEQLPGGGLRFLEFEIFELSMVAVGAQQDAEILEVRAGHRARAAKVRHSGRLPVVKLGRFQPTKTSRPVVHLNPERSRRLFDIRMRRAGLKVPFFLNAEARAKWYRTRIASAKARGVMSVIPPGWDIK